MRGCTRGCSPWRHRSPRCLIRPRAWLSDDLRFRASSGCPSQTWLATSQCGPSVCLPAVDHRELDGRDPKALREHVYFSAVFGNLELACGGQTTLFSWACQEGFGEGRLCRRFTKDGEGAGTFAIRRSLIRVFDELLRWRTSSGGCGGALASHRGVPRGSQAIPVKEAFVAGAHQENVNGKLRP